MSYVKELSEAFARLLKSHGIATANRPHRTLRNFVVHPKDKVKDEEKTELIYRVPCRSCSSSYVGEMGGGFGLGIREHRREVDSFKVFKMVKDAPGSDTGAYLTCASTSVVRTPPHGSVIWSVVGISASFEIFT